MRCSFFMACLCDAAILDCYVHIADEVLRCLIVCIISGSLFEGPYSEDYGVLEGLFFQISLYLRAVKLYEVFTSAW